MTGTYYVPLNEDPPSSAVGKKKKKLRHGLLPGLDEIHGLVIGVPGQRPDFPELRLTQPQPRKPTFSKPHPKGSFQPCASWEAAHVGLLAVVAILGFFKKTQFDTLMCVLSIKVAR